MRGVGEGTNTHISKKILHFLDRSHQTPSQRRKIRMAEWWKPRDQETIEAGAEAVALKPKI